MRRASLGSRVPGYGGLIETRSDALRTLDWSPQASSQGSSHVAAKLQRLSWSLLWLAVARTALGDPPLARPHLRVAQGTQIHGQGRRGIEMNELNGFRKEGRSISLSLPRSLTLSLILPPSLSLSLSKHTHTHMHSDRVGNNS